MDHADPVVPGDLVAAVAAWADCRAIALG